MRREVERLARVWPATLPRCVRAWHERAACAPSPRATSQSKHEPAHYPTDASIARFSSSRSHPRCCAFASSACCRRPPSPSHRLSSLPGAMQLRAAAAAPPSLPTRRLLRRHLDRVVGGASCAGRRGDAAPSLGHRANGAPPKLPPSAVCGAKLAARVVRGDDLSEGDSGTKEWRRIVEAGTLWTDPDFTADASAIEGKARTAATAGAKKPKKAQQERRPPQCRCGRPAPRQAVGRAARPPHV